MHRPNPLRTLPPNVFVLATDKCRERKNYLGVVMRKLITALLLIVSSQLTVWASDKVIVELGPNARASAVAAAVGGEVLESIPGSTHILMKVPSAAAAAALARNPQSGIVSVE